MSHYREKIPLRELVISLGYSVLTVFSVGLLFAFDKLIRSLG